MGTWRSDIEACRISAGTGVDVHTIERLNAGMMDWADRAARDLAALGADEKTLVAYSEATSDGYMVTMWGSPHYRSRFIVKLNCST